MPQTQIPENYEFYKLYYRYLCETVGIKYGYDEVLKLLFFEDFVSLIPNDDNRIEDGLDIRKKFAYEMQYEIMPNDPCSVFEMLIGLANRVAFIILDPYGNSPPDLRPIFWEFIKNLRLQPGSIDNDNKGIIENFVERKYRYDGYGGIFPIVNPREDQTKVELWYQMMSYVNERYFNI